MKSESNGRLELVEAAAPTLRDISRLAVTAPPRIAAMLIYIRDHLFDPKLSVYRVKEACRSRDNSVALYFHRIVGQPPGTFIADKRLAVAERLLVGTWLPIWKIAELLGYSSIQVFSRAYYRRKRKRPTAFRREGAIEAPPVEIRPDSAPVSAKSSQPEGDLLQRALAGQLDDEEAAHLIWQLLQVYPPRRSAASLP
jgi:AraC-like DNA-binding protein